MAFGSKKPEIKTRKEIFADALAKYREEEAALKKSKILLDSEILDLRATADNYDSLVAGAKQRLLDLQSQIGIAETQISDKQKQHLVWVDGVLQEEAKRLRAAIDSNRVLGEILEAERASIASERSELGGLKLILEEGIAQLKSDRAKFKEEQTQERLQAIDDRKRLDVLVADHKELVRVLEAREKETRPIPKPITIQKRRRLK